MRDHFRIRGARRLKVVIALVSVAGLTASVFTGTAASAVSVPSNVNVSSFGVTFAPMTLLKPLTHAGKGLVGVILPDTTSSIRYVDFNAPYFHTAFHDAGYSLSQYKIDNAQGVDANELSLA